ncbi:MAG TPA: DUF4834 family protein [Sphingobacteriaceae bacterium]|nr:DUF4834 family protein [Sphingobacteriaceae bacterium]
MSYLLKFLLIAIAILWLLRVVARFLFPWALRKTAERVMKDQGQQPYGRSPFSGNGPQQPRKSPKPDGKVRIDYVPPKEERKGPQKAGEFVDFEEVK